MEIFKPKVSIVIPVYNGANYLREAIESALAQTYKNIEIIVVNDGSRDNGQTESIALSYDSKIRYFSKPNGGVATALNLGIEKMTGEYFSWLSHDDVYYQNKIETQICYLNSLSDKKTILYGGYHVINERSEVVGDMLIERQADVNLLNAGIYPLLNGCINGCTLLIHKDCFIDVGQFDNNLRTTQDYALWFKMFRKHPVFFHKEILLKSRAHSEQGSLKESVHLKEATDLWMSFIEETTEHDIKNSYNTLSAFYYKMAVRLKSSYVPKAYHCALDKFKQIKHEIKVSVVLPTYNRGWCIHQAIDSVLKQHTNCKYELIVIDDGSTDNTQNVIETYKNEITYIYQENKGAAAARNNGIKNAKGEYIAFIDSDDIWSDDHLEKHIRVLDENIEYAMTYNLAHVVDHKNNKNGEHALKVHLDGQIYPEMLFIKNNIITTPSVVVRKLIFDQVGFFDETMDMCEDLDLWRRIAKHYKVKCIPEFLTIVKTRENQFDPSLFYSKRKQYIEKAIADDDTMPAATILDLYIELCNFYYLGGCCYHLIYKDLTSMAARDDAIGNALKEHIIKTLANYDQTARYGIKPSAKILIKEFLKKVGIDYRIIKRAYQKSKNIFAFS